MAVAGLATTAVGTGAAAAATVRVVRAELAALAVNDCAVVTALDWVTVVDCFAAVATPAEVGVVEKLTVGAGVLLDWAWAGVDEFCSVSGAGADGGVLG
jgi:hypothetical protein